ncbi:MAG: SEL1-like repeat protein [Alphaproteobacteria bacterium]|nr:SEL1-like repeat protein [Alphaproteobacteria bacterium]
MTGASALRGIRKKARQHFRKAAEGGNAAAMHNLALLEAGKGETNSAEQWFIKAARRGIRDSQFNLAVLHFRGIGVKQDLTEAWMWFALAAVRGDRVALERRDEVAMQLSDEALKAAEEATRSYVVEPQPDNAVRVPAPPGGWDDPSADEAVGNFPTANTNGMQTDPAPPTRPAPDAVEYAELPDAIGGAKLRRAALQGDPAAAYEVGLRFAQGRGAPENYLLGRDLPQNYPQAAQWFRKAERAGVVPAAFQLAILYENGQGVPRDADRAIHSYRKAAEGGYAAAMLRLAMLEDHSGNYETAAQWFRKAAVYGVADSAFNLAFLYYRGTGVERDPVEAYKWFSLAARRGDPQAMQWRDNLAMQLSDEAFKTVEEAVRSFVVVEPPPDEAFGAPAPVDGWDATSPDDTAGRHVLADIGRPQTVPPSPAAAAPPKPELPDAIGRTTLRDAAFEGNPAAAYEVGMRFAIGRGVPRNDLRAARWFRKADLAGLVPGAFQVGVLFERGQGLEKNLEKAGLYYLKAAERGCAAAMHRLGRLEADKGEYNDAVQWFTKAARHGIAESHFNLGVLHYEGLGVTRDFRQSYKWFALAAKRGDRDARNRRNDVAMLLNAQSLKAENLAVRSFVVVPQPAEAVHVPRPAPAAAVHLPVKEDLTDAIRSRKLRRAALSGDPAAAYEIGMRFLKAWHGIPDHVRALIWFERAEQAGLVPASFQLGVLYEKSPFVVRDREKTLQYYRKAAERGNAAAMHNFAVMEADGSNFRSAARWFIKAARHGVTDSQFNLAVLYFRGLGVERNFAESCKWFALAAAHGDQDALDRRNDVATWLNDAERKTAEEAIKDFVVEPQPKDAFEVSAPGGGWD